MASSTHSELSLNLADRPYECPCKKSYKSYPALFTHIKNKHDGIVRMNLLSLPEASRNPFLLPRNLEDGQPISRNRLFLPSLYTRTPPLSFSSASKKKSNKLLPFPTSRPASMESFKYWQICQNSRFVDSVCTR
jgi:hypothetical protein